MAKEISENGISQHRSARLYRLLNMLAEKAKSRELILKKFKIDIRAFYRDIEFLRSLGIHITTDNGNYVLETDIEEAMQLLPFPDPILSVQEMLHLVQGNATVRKKLKKKVEAVLGPIGG